MTMRTHEFTLSIETLVAHLSSRARVRQRRVVDPTRGDRGGRRRVHDACRPFRARFRAGKQRGEEKLRQEEVS